MILKTARMIFVLTATLLITFVSGEASAVGSCFKDVCRGYYFTGDMTGYSWSANRKGIVRPNYASFRRENRTVVVQVDKIYNNGTFTTRTYDINDPKLVVTSKSTLRVNNVALEKGRRIR